MEYQRSNRMYKDKNLYTPTPKLMERIHKTMINRNNQDKTSYEAMFAIGAVICMILILIGVKLWQI